MQLVIEELTVAEFLEFGEVIEARDDARQFVINNGFATRFHDVANIDTGRAGGTVCVSVFRAIARSLPLQLTMMERHPLGSQAFVAMSDQPFLVVVAPPDDELDINRLRCFITRKGQGVNYARGTWHHPLIALDVDSDFLVIDRSGAPQDHNLDEADIRRAGVWVSGFAASTLE